MNEEPTKREIYDAYVTYGLGMYLANELDTALKCFSKASKALDELNKETPIIDYGFQKKKLEEICRRFCDEKEGILDPDQKGIELNFEERNGIMYLIDEPKE